MSKKQHKRRINLTKEACILQGGKCYYCGDKIHFGDGLSPHRATFEHMVPASQGGDISAANCVASCSTCNSLRGTINWLRWIKFTRTDMFKICISNIKRHRTKMLKTVRDLDKELKAAVDTVALLKQQRKRTTTPVKKVVKKYTKRIREACNEN
jgi:hypothetical protein